MYTFCSRKLRLQVLKGDFLPPSVADEQMTDLLRAIPEQPGMLERVVGSLFSLATAPQQTQISGGAGPGNAAWRDAAALEAAGVPLAVDAEARALVVQAVSAACAAHGAVPMQSAEVRTPRCTFALPVCDLLLGYYCLSVSPSLTPSLSLSLERERERERQKPVL